MKNFLVYTVLFLLPLFSISQNGEKVRIITKNQKGIITSVEFPASVEKSYLPRSAGDFFEKYLEVSEHDQFENVPHRSRRPGFIHEHYDQYYQGVKVQDAGYNFHYKNGEMYFANGHYVKIENLNATPILNLEEAIESFLKYKGIGKEDVANTVTELLIKEISSNDTLTSVVLVYRIYLESDHPKNTEVGYINAHTGELAEKEPRLTHLLGTFETRYSGTQQAVTDPVADGHRLFDNSRGATIHTQSMQNNTTIIANAVELIDNDNNWTAEEHAGNNNDMGLDVHWGLQQIYDYLNNAHGINSYDDAGEPISSYVRYGNDDNLRDNAFWDMTLNVMYFGQGVTNFSPLASLDVVAHEFGHGITDFQIGWPYAGDQASFHEGMSDIWGAILEHRINPGATWRIGEQVTLNNPYLRNLENTNDANAFTQIANTFESSQYNSGGIYERSGVLSHWFYLLVNGGSGTNDLSQSYSVIGMGMDIAEEILVEAVFNNYLDNTTTYPAIRTAMINAASAVCNNPNITQSVTNAWHAVGVGDPYSGTVMEITGPSLVCTSGANFTLNNAPAGATITWSATPANLFSTASGTGTTANLSAANGMVRGVGTLTFEIQGDCGSVPIEETFWVGPPLQAHNSQLYVQGFYGQNPITLAPDAAYNFQIEQADGASSFTWDLPSGFSFMSGFCTTCDVAKIWTSPNNGYYVLKVSPINICGTAGFKSLDIYIGSPGGGGGPSPGCPDPPCAVPEPLSFPNPAKSSLTVKIPDNPDTNSKETLLTIRIYDRMNRLVLETYTRDPEIDVSLENLPTGHYVLHIIHGKEIKTSHLMVER